MERVKQIFTPSSFRDEQRDVIYVSNEFYQILFQAESIRVQSFFVGCFVKGCCYLY
ncbi:hypothetical protein KIS4809_5156 [Bacillus sp. ZZV12-4809]|nr:hypothetical protein KIS4809_5156 [Bacillus sp. ZZV12-4809]